MHFRLVVERHDLSIAHFARKHVLVFELINVDLYASYFACSFCSPCPVKLAPRPWTACWGANICLNLTIIIQAELRSYISGYIQRSNDQCQAHCLN